MEEIIRLPSLGHDQGLHRRVGSLRKLVRTMAAKRQPLHRAKVKLAARLREDHDDGELDRATAAKGAWTHVNHLLYWHRQQK